MNKYVKELGVLMTKANEQICTKNVLERQLTHVPDHCTGSGKNGNEEHRLQPQPVSWDGE